MTTDFKWVKGHSGNLENEECDHLAKEGANLSTSDHLSLDIPKEFDLQGAKLASLTQTIAYQGIRELHPDPPCPSTATNVQATRNSIEQYNSVLKTDSTIWKGIWNPTLRPRVRQFLYKTMHNTQKIGIFWSRTMNPELRQRQQCAICDETDSMDHILTTCSSGEADTIWTLAKETWPYAPRLWPNITISIIRGCGSLTLPDAAANNMPKKTAQGATRLLIIIISESAHLIWILRCERVIQQKTHSPSEIRARWLSAINRRLTEDKIIATKIMRNNRSLQRVTNTWETLLKKEGNLPINWIDNSEVLVGRRPPQTA